MARDISELGADVFDDTPKPARRISAKKRNYIIGCSIGGVFLVGVVIAAVVLCNTALSDYSNVTNVSYYFTQKSVLEEGEKPYAVLYKLDADHKFGSTFRIPSQIKGYKVVGVADEAFLGHDEIKKVVMPNTVKWIGDRVFAKCTNLSSFSWSKNLQDIGVDAFEGTKFYENLLAQPNSFYDIPSGILIYAGTDYFKPNTALISDNLSAEKQDLIRTKYGVSEFRRFSELNVNKICAGAFKNNDKIVYIDLPDSINEVAKCTFEDCSNLRGINGENSSITYIGDSAFAGCYNLVDIDIPESVKYVGDFAFSQTGVVDKIPDLSKVEELGEYLFSGCEDLVSAVYTAKTVPAYTFSECTSLSSLEWGEGNANADEVSFIGIGAFESTAFTEFTFPKSITSVMDKVFRNCESLAKVSLYGNPNHNLIEPEEDEDDSSSTKVYTYIDEDGNEQEGILMGVRSIKANAFEGCTSLSTINLYDDTGAVYKGENNEFTFPYSLIHTNENTTIDGIDNKVFAGTKPTKVVASPNLKNIGSYAFMDATLLEHFEIEHFDKSQLNTINDGAFKNCESLTELSLPGGIKKVGASVFMGCPSLVSVNLGDTGATQIAGELFAGCHSLESIVIPNTATSIKPNAFYQTYSLNYVVVPYSVCEIQNRAFKECRNVAGEKMNVYISRTVAQATQGTGKISFGDSWKDGTVEAYFLLGEGEEKQEGYNYWQLNEVTGEPEII